jgi:hypothetical protein
MNVNLTDLFMIEPMNGASVNGWLLIPPSFTIMIYCAVVTITAMGFLYFVKKKKTPLQALRISIIIAFFCSSFLYLVYSERTWYAWCRHDVETYAGHSTEEKNIIDFGSIYDFATAAQKVLKTGEYTLYSSNRSFSLIAQYYLLPKRDRSDANNILVFYDTAAAYDSNTKTFTRGNTRIENAEMLFYYNPDAYILRVR